MIRSHPWEQTDSTRPLRSLPLADHQTGAGIRPGPHL